MNDSFWQNDPLFNMDLANPEYIGNLASPAFRLSMLSSIDQAHPFEYEREYSQIFNLFEPFLRKNAERLIFIEEGGASPRRRKSIKDTDWHPYQYMNEILEKDDRYFIGFSFESGKVDFKGSPAWARNIFDRGPTQFTGEAMRTSNLDATISVEDFLSGALDVDALIKACLRLPFGTMISGYGLSLSDHSRGRGDESDDLIPIAEKYPAIDIAHNFYRSWSPDKVPNTQKYWIAGINWLTGVGEPFLSTLGGKKKLLSKLSSEIIVHEGPNGLIFQLGPHPITGLADVDDELLPLYHELGKKMAPLKKGCPSTKYPRGHCFGNEGLNLLWERRFYDGSWFERK